MFVHEKHEKHERAGERLLGPQAASMEMVDLAVAWSPAQLNTIPAVFIGAIFFREVHFATHRKTIYLGLLVATVGTVLLGLAK